MRSRSGNRPERQAVVATFARWLNDQSGRAQNDPIGWLARAWGSLEPDNRARISSPTKIKQVLAEQGSQTAEWQGYLTQAVDAAVAAYRERGDGPAAVQGRIDAISTAAERGEPAAAELAGEGTMTADPDPHETRWSTPPHERLGTCLQCGALMGVAVTGAGVKVLMCANGHPIGPKAAQQLIAAADKQPTPDEAYDAAIERGDEHLPAPSDPETVDHDEVARSVMGRQHQLDRIEAALAAGQAVDDGTAESVLARLDQLSAQLAGTETMLGLLAQMLAAASPAAAQVLAEFVQAEGGSEAQHAMGAVTEADFEPDPRWQRLPEQEMPASFQAYYGMAPGRPGDDDG